MKRLLLAAALIPLPLCAQDLAGREWSLEELEALRNLVKPPEGEFDWYEEIPWMTRIQPAREQAAAEGKPLLIWTSADGQPCGAG